MKFAKVFQQALNDEQIPSDWIEKAIQYKQLKKRINKVVNELEDLNIYNSDIKVNNYEIEIINNNKLHTNLNIPITSITKNRLINQLNNSSYNYEIVPINDDNDTTSDINPFDDSIESYNLKISLLEDTKFFQILYNEVETLEKFKFEEEEIFKENIESMCSIISTLTIPNKRNNDLLIWRQIFKIYIESEIFFSTVERMAGKIDNIDLSRDRLILFFKKINETKLLDKFHNKQSLNIYQNFKTLNFEIIKVSNYEKFNNLAVKKILKKFDKNTHFHSKDVFSSIIHKKTNDITNISLDIYYIINSKLLPIIPQIDDYLCPICCSIAIKPIRLKCSHLFCIRCLVKLRRKREDKCPLCREECLLELTVNNLDESLYKYMKLYFPVEVKEKEMENSREIIKEQMGESSGNINKCLIM